MCARPNFSRSRDAVAGTKPEFLGCVTRIVASLMPNGGYSIAQMTGLSAEDLIDLGMAQAAAIAETWNPEGGLSLSSWVSQRLRNRLIDCLRNDNSITRGQYSVLQKFWAKQESLGGQGVPLMKVREALLLEPDTKLSPQKLDEAIAAWTIAVARNLSGLNAEAEENGQKKESNDPGFEMVLVDEEEEIERRVSLFRLITSSLYSPSPYASRASFLYLFPGLTMKEIGIALSVSQSRISQVLTQVIPEQLIRAFGREIPGYDPSCFPPKVDRETRKILRRFREETIDLWSFLPDEVRKELDAEIVYQPVAEEVVAREENGSEKERPGVRETALIAEGDTPPSLESLLS